MQPRARTTAICLTILAAMGAAYLLGRTSRPETPEGPVDRAMRPGEGGVPGLVGRGDGGTSKAPAAIHAARIAVTFPAAAGLDGARLALRIRQEASDRSERVFLRTYLDDVSVTGSSSTFGRPEPGVEGLTVFVALPAMSAGRYEVSARTLDPSPMLLQAGPASLRVPEQGNLELTLTEADESVAHITVCVLRADGTRVDRAGVHVASTAGFERTVTTSLGPYGDLLNLPAGAYEVSVASYPGSYLLGLPDPQSILLRGGDVRDVVFRLAPVVGKVRFMVRTPSGERVPYFVTLWKQEDGVWTAVNFTGLFRTDPGSEDKLSSLPFGHYRAHVIPTHIFGAVWRRFDLTDGGAEVQVLIDLEESRDPPLRLRLLGPDGRPAGRIRLNVNAVIEVVGDGNACTTKTDATGLAVTRPMPLGRYSVWFWDLGIMCFLEHDGAGKTHVIRIDARSCDPEVRSCARLRGRVVLPDGRSSTGCSLVLMGPDIKEQLVMHRFVDAVGGGRFEFSKVQPGMYRLWIPFRQQARPRTQAYTSEAFSLQGGEEAERDVHLALDVPAGSSPR